MNAQPRKRLSADVRKNQILKAAVEVAKVDGYDNLTREAVAARARCATGQISRLFGTVDALRDAVIERAVDLAETGDASPEVLAIVARGLVLGNASARGASEAVKQRAITSIV